MLKTKKKVDKAQTRHKKKLDKRLEKQLEVITEGNDVLLRLEMKKAKNQIFKLALVADGPFKVTKEDDKTVVIEQPDRSVERVFRSRVLLEPKQ